MENKPVNIFWTGGWDSTFRVLQLLIEEKKKVQPHFVVRPQASVGKEITTMIDIRRKLFRKYPETKDLLLPTLYVDIRGVYKYSAITKAYQILSRKYEIAQQYDFCSRYCFQNDIHDMELSIEQESNPQIFLDPYLDSESWIDPQKMDEDGQNMYEIFRYYKFPILNKTKIDMALICKENEWDDIMKMTWFCAAPTNGKPCGFCGPCTYTIEEGISWRIPAFRRIFSIIHMPFRKFYRDKIKFKL